MDQPAAIYLAICAAVAAVYLTIERRLARTVLPAATEQRRRAIEVSIVTTICACFFFAHYYYLILLVIPFNVLLATLPGRWSRRRIVLWGISYFLVGAFVVPVGLLSRLAGFNVFEFYMWQSWFWYGEILLVVLLLFEYHRLGTAAMIPSRSIR